MSKLGNRTRKPWSKFIKPDNEHLVSPEALELIDGLIRYDHQVCSIRVCVCACVYVLVKDMPQRASLPAWLAPNRNPWLRQPNCVKHTPNPCHCHFLLR